jgi:hypothetical protein
MRTNRGEVLGHWRMGHEETLQWPCVPESFFEEVEETESVLLVEEGRNG